MWSKVRERPFFGLDSIEEAEENVAKVQENLKTAQRRQKGYANKRQTELTFEVGDHVYLKVSPLEGTRRFHVKGRLAPEVYRTLLDYQKDRGSSLQATVAI